MFIQDNASWDDVRDARPGIEEILRWKLPPKDTEWKWANVEECDKDRLLLLPGCFDMVSQGTGRLADAARYFDDHFRDGTWISGTHDEHYERKLTAIMNTVDEGQGVLIVVADNEAGPFTLLDANHRAIFFTHRQTIVGRNVLLGIHAEMRGYRWHKS